MSQWRREGSCNRFCGRCCTATAFAGNPAVIAQFPGLKDNGECIELDWINGQAVCKIYGDRPDLCKVFPAAPIEIATIPECGFTFIPLEEVANGGSMVPQR